MSLTLSVRDSSRARRRSFLQTGLCGGAAMAASGAPAPARRPNIIVIVADDMGYADTGFNGCRDYDTPNLDRLAQSGVRFTNGYVTHPYCSPSRAGLLTGRYQQRFGHEHNPPWEPRNPAIGMDTAERTIADELKEAGYATGMIGKWHLGAAPHFHPLRRGFAEMFGFLGGGHDYHRAAGGGRENLAPLERNGEEVRETEYLTDAFSREAVSFIKRHRGDPFFLYLAYNAPHAPNHATERYLRRAGHIAYPGRMLYAALNAGLDEGVGAVLSALEETKIRENTLIAFLSDNGGRKDGADNRPLRGFKGMLHEGGIRVPFVMSWPAALAPKRRYDQPVSSLDILPTALAAAGAKRKGEKPLDGVNLLPYLSGRNPAAPHDVLYWRTAGGRGYAVRRGRYKLVKDIPMERPQVFDLSVGILESRDLADGNEKLTAELTSLYRKWNAPLRAPVWTENHVQKIERDYQELRDARQRSLPPSPE